MQDNPMQKYRHEFKYVIGTSDVALLQSRLQHLLVRDTHSGNTGGYRVRSLYFDSFDNRCYYENESGTDPREKFRIRLYNASTEYMVLECKRKERGKTQKQSCPLTLTQVKTLMAGQPLRQIADQPPLLQKLTMYMLRDGYRPAVIVEYDRIPYVYPSGNVRVTLDTNIASSVAIASFLEKQLPRRPVMPLGQQILEVKYDEYLPDPIFGQLQLQNLTQTAYSKYYICRKYSL